jgi:hypothetical protein
MVTVRPPSFSLPSGFGRVELIGCIGHRAWWKPVSTGRSGLPRRLSREWSCGRTRPRIDSLRTPESPAVEHGRAIHRNHRDRRRIACFLFSRVGLAHFSRRSGMFSRRRAASNAMAVICDGVANASGWGEAIRNHSTSPHQMKPLNQHLSVEIVQLMHIRWKSITSARFI